MAILTFALIVFLAQDTQPLGAGDHTRILDVDGRRRSFIVHIPPAYDPGTPTPLVLVFHGFGADAARMVHFCGMSGKADQAGFIVVYPYGTGMGVVRGFNGGALKGPLAEGMPDDVAFADSIIDDLSRQVNVDPKRVYAAGMSNGAMMCFRLAMKLPNRFAAIATVAGTMAEDLGEPTRPVPVIHFHGTVDSVIPFDGPPDEAAEFLDIKSVRETIELWARVNRCRPKPVVSQLENVSDDGTSVTKTGYLTPAGDARVVLYTIEGGGHTWPGQSPALAILGKSTKDISGNDLIWEFFQKHSLP